MITDGLPVRHDSSSDIARRASPSIRVLRSREETGRDEGIYKKKEKGPGHIASHSQKVAPSSQQVLGDDLAFWQKFCGKTDFYHRAFV